MLLVKKSEGWYNIYNNKVGIGSTHSELQGYKLCKQNCDEIFGVLDVEKLAIDEIGKRNLSGQIYNNHEISIFIKGFNKAMELNKDKQFTSRDMLSAYMEGTNDGTQFESLMDYDSQDFDDAHEFAKQAEREFIQSLQQPTEIKVEIDMEEYGYCEGCRKAGMWHCAHADTCGYAETRQQPKLDANGCIILKKILKK